MIRLARAAGALVALVVLVAALTPALERAELATLDARFELRGTQPVAGLAVVAIDERSFSELETRWPFPRTLHAQLIDRLREAGARQIVYDVQFTEPSEDPDEDLALYEAVGRAGRVVLATGEVDDHGRTRVLGGDENLAQAGGARAAASTFPTDPGGAIRRYARQDTGLATIPALVGARFGPTPTAERALIDFRGPAGTIPTYSFADVLERRVSEPLRGRIVVVGATAPSLQDVHPTSAPGDRLMPGAELQANAIWTALEGNPLRPVAGWLAFLIAVLLAGVPAAGVRLLGPVRGSALAAAGAALFAVGAQLAFGAGLVLPVAVPLVALACTLATALLVRAVAERSERAAVSRHRDELEAAVHARTKDLVETQLEVVLRLARAAELHDDDTGEHIDRMSRMCGEVALELGLPPTRADTIRYAAVLHDIGKIGVPDEILRKPGGLTIEEMAVMRRHVVEGSLLLEGSPSPVLKVAELIVDTHHERWDGTGYPNGLKGEEIALEGRIAAVCDVFDALTHERPYKQAWTVEHACQEIERLRGSHFDPAVADALLRVVRRRR
ncbi:CHASE2 domain-containing protein [Solirubrobacter sp. CPCC 204708]|uniref:CHASE2 domain-containing protein n=1 Tax=Solirubrobacter deserti TaxID=2282478 RepID=A0ABT4RHV9_9ACTN|nr:CHASE2 domain-containing protein [Solirubrobacter deserti]MBE2316546.1 CHASE2 domain-containing protein [Solirubrobacter deserti]MDA0138080.1 CHASE2 domain-containing protein [Solirubrobacter deserti]